MGPGRPMELNGGELLIGGKRLSWQQTSSSTERAGVLLAEQLRRFKEKIIRMYDAEGSVTILQGLMSFMQHNGDVHTKNVY